MKDGDADLRRKACGATVLYGGSFDPPHLGHQMACLYLLEGLAAEQVWLVPTFRHPLKAAGTSFAARVMLCRLLAKPLKERVHVCEAEEALGGRGFTYDLICYLKKKYPERRFVLAIGADLMAETPLWHRFDDLKALIDVVVIGRQGHPLPYRDAFCLPNITSSQLRADLAAGISVLGRMPHAVAQAIAEKQLYGSGSPGPAGYRDAGQK